ncbi:MAG: hypothetical protein M9894_34935 [Planctomycetes bacterium]|nr:hypothetical protein [Planctomycetota bacterium]
MGPRRRVLLALAAAALVVPARADVVHLTNGRTIGGRVVDEDGERVVVKTPAGRVTVPRRDVLRVEREGEPRTLLREARQAATSGDLAAARRLYAAAADAGDVEVAAIARREVEGLAAPAAPADEAGTQEVPAGIDPFAEVEREALIRELEAAAPTRPDLARRLAYELFQRAERRHAARECRLAASDYGRARLRVEDEAQRRGLEQRERRCRLEVAAQALRRRDPTLARAAAEPVVDDPDLGRRAAYLLGRAEERLRRPRPAREAYQQALRPVAVPADHDLATMRELARLASVGIPVDTSTPGLAAGWRCLQTRHFSILHPGPIDRAFGERVEGLRGEVLARLGLRTVDDQASIALFLFPDDGAYQGAPGARAWSAGHAARLQGDGEVVPTIYLHTQGDADARLRHELAHILVGDALQDALLPMWAAEGVAIYAEHEEARARWRAHARQLHRKGELRPVREALGQMLMPLTDEREAVLRFYVQASVLFDVLARRVGVERALQGAQRINVDGPEQALRSIGVGLEGFERAVEAALREP